MDKLKFKQLLHKIIQEEVKKAVKSELQEIKQLLESQTSSFKPKIESKATNTLFKNIAPQNNIQSLLYETAQSMNGSDYRTMVNANSSLVTGLPDMQMSMNPINDLSAPTPSFYPQPEGEISIDNISSAPVPDFREMMSLMKTKGMI